MKAPIACIRAAGGGVARYDSEWRMNVRNFMALLCGFESTTNEAVRDRHEQFFFRPLRWDDDRLDYIGSSVWARIRSTPPPSSRAGP
jgi:hypothetical protein